MSPDEAEEFTQSLAQVASGAWRQIALAQRLGVPKTLGLTTEQWVNDRLGGYIKRSAAERYDAAKTLAIDGYSTGEIAEILGVSRETVRLDAKHLAPIDAVAALAAGDALRKQVEVEARKADNVAKRAAAREAPVDFGFTTAQLEALIAAGCKYNVVYGDPPWTFEVYSGKGKSRSAEEHYDTMTLDEIKALPIAALAADDCALFLWCVMPQIPEALEVIRAWGFEFKTVAFVWVKTTEKSKFIDRTGDGLHWGMGYWTRANAEIVLLATRGAPKRVAMDVHQVVVSPVSDHSRKPDEVQVRIEQLLDGPYLELFGRRATEHWTVWGNTITRDLFHQDIPEFTQQEQIT